MGKKVFKNCRKHRAKRKKRSSSTKILSEMANKEFDIPASDESNEISQSMPIDNSCSADDDKNVSGKENLSLQEAFLRFREKRQKEIMELETENDTAAIVDEIRMAELRRKFLNRCISYIGVPYKKKYQKPGTPEYNSKLFLDCCGLVRRALRDLRKDFRFTIGPWNQAYMFDTLPIEVKREEDMKPGDLVFISGIYFKKMRVQPHHMVHVEVWLGDGPKTIGARWRKGCVQVFDSYQFVSTSYHSMTYHFRSIDTWLQGTCKSFCQKHKWKRPRRATPSKKSIFFETQPSVTTQSQSDRQQNIEDITDIDASQDESERAATPCDLKNNLSTDEQFDLCQGENDDDQSEEQNSKKITNKSNVERSVSSNQPKYRSVASETKIKYVSLSKKINISESTKDKSPQIKAPESCLVIKEHTNGRFLRKTKPASAVHRPCSRHSPSPRPKTAGKVTYVFTNKPIPRDALIVNATQIVKPTTSGSDSSNKAQDDPKVSQATLKLWNNDKKVVAAADMLVKEAIERALAETKSEKNAISSRSKSRAIPSKNTTNTVFGYETVSFVFSK